MVNFSEKWDKEEKRLEGDNNRYDKFDSNDSNPSNEKINKKIAKAVAKFIEKNHLEHDEFESGYAYRLDKNNKMIDKRYVIKCLDCNYMHEIKIGFWDRFRL